MQMMMDDDRESSGPSEAEQYLQAVAAESRSLFGGHGALVHLGATATIATAPPRTTGALSKYFPSLGGASLPTALLPPPAFTARTLRTFTSLRQHFLALRERLEEESTRYYGCSEEGGWRKRLPLPQSLVEIIPTAPFPIGAWFKLYHRLLHDEAEEPHQPTLSFFLALDPSRITMLLHVICRAALSDGRGWGSGSRRDRGHHDEDSSNNDDDDYQDDNTEEGQEEQQQEDSGSGDDPQELRFARRLSSKGHGLWLWCALIALDVPLEGATERLLQELLQRCCAALRFITPLSTALNTMGEEDEEDNAEAAALHTFIIVVGKFFRQANRDVLPL